MMNRILLVFSIVCFLLPQRALAHGSIEQSAIGTATGQHGLLCQMLASGLITPTEAKQAVDMIVRINQQSFASMNPKDVVLTKKAFNFAWDYIGEIAKDTHPSCPLGTSILQ